MSAALAGAERSATAKVASSAFLIVIEILRGVGCTHLAAAGAEMGRRDWGSDRDFPEFVG
jgi:hypothetical protein